MALKELRKLENITHHHIVVYVASYEEYCLQTRGVEISHRKARGSREISHSSQQVIKKHIIGIATYPPGQCNLGVFLLECAAGMQSESGSGSEDGSQAHDDADGWWKIPYLHTYFGCLSQAVAYLHGQQIQIRDLKPENVVMDQYGLPVLTDFGLSRHFHTGHHSSGPTRRSQKYTEPENDPLDAARDERSDVFSLGCIFLEMATVIIGRPPWFAETQLAIASSAERTATSLDFEYRDALDTLDSYITQLVSIADAVVKENPENPKRKSLLALIIALPTIGQMMHPEFRRRPYAKDLYPLFWHLYDVSGTPGRCPTCEEERNGPFDSQEHRKQTEWAEWAER